ncbi:MAG TPA: bifunctional polysaccharide deacetylase/glycosyltransferase family 2 protein [Candidatus Saccharimonadales bacterium]|nr:bifunctional polysaccharide deacetylase/glycosyltransferase family 2 protein [Candidatus Saccharimonadales bacterium]
MMEEEKPVFFDQNGKRWLKTKVVLSVILVATAALVMWMIPQVTAHKSVNAFQTSVDTPITNNTIHHTTTPTIDQLNAQLSGENTPVIGEGSLVRLIRVTEHGGEQYGVDPFSRKVIRPLTAKELMYIGGEPYVIERYGHTADRRIAITFDDGPHPVYTPQLLDLLSRESAQASFFTLGSNVAKYPEIAQRIVREGHTIANHSFTHIDFGFGSSFQQQQEINQTERVISATTNRTTSFFRIPYGGNTDQSLRNSIVALLTAQKMGYTVTSYNFDSNDWQFTTDYPKEYPTFDGEDKIVLVHDSGGNRSHTIEYVENLIRMAKENGYDFVTLNELYPQAPALVVSSEPSVADQAALTGARAALVWPHDAITSLFGISIASIILTTLVNIILALRQRAKTKKSYQPIAPFYTPRTTIVIPSYNEGKVIVKTVDSLLQSWYENIEIIIVDDGSTDDTWDIAQSIADQHEKVMAIHQVNGGKSSALNNAIEQSRGEIIICVDADTIFPPQTVTMLVRHFKDPAVGAVAGVVKVGNVQGIVTLWQALEYMLSITIERNAQALLNSIMIIPGACGAWRKSAIIEAGGLSHSTLAEDCDLTLNVQALARYKILQDNDAISYTEAPQKIKSLIKQRFRWTFGNIQSLWKHHDMLFDRQYGWLGSFVMPNAIISIAIPLFFWPILVVISIQNIITGNYMVILIYFVISLSLQFLIATIGVLMTHERLRYIVAVPFARFIYGPIRTYILYKTVLTALKGSYVGWNKLMRTGAATYPSAKDRPRRTPVNTASG